MSTSKERQIVRRMVEAAGHTTQSLGIGRVLGQIFAYLYFSPEAQSLNDLTKALGISKGSASMGVRQLEQWGALEKVWVKGDRKDYYRARDAFGKILKNAIADIAGKRMESSSTLLGEVEIDIGDRTMDENTLSENDAFVKERVEKLLAFQKKAKGIWESAILKMLLR